MFPTNAELISYRLSDQHPRNMEHLVAKRVSFPTSKEEIDAAFKLTIPHKSLVADRILDRGSALDRPTSVETLLGKPLPSSQPLEGGADVGVREAFTIGGALLAVLVTVLHGLIERVGRDDPAAHLGILRLDDLHRRRQFLGDLGVPLNRQKGDGPIATKIPAPPSYLSARVLAFERGANPASIAADVPTEITTATGLFAPMNYNRQCHGPIRYRLALGNSLNIPAVKTLVLVGAEPFVERLRQLGLAGLTEAGDFYGPSLALGSADVSLWEIVNAYRTLANGGVWRPLRMRPDEPRAGGQRRLYSAETAFLVSHILADREARSGTFGLENPLATPFWTAVKTGTSKEMRDNWCIGYSRRYIVGVWVGNFSGAPMWDVSGVTGAAPVWAEIMAWLHRRAGSVPPRPPGALRAARVAFPGDLEPSRLEWFLSGTEPRAAERFLAAAPPRILAPADGTLIALDPDIPAARQRVMFEAQTHGTPVDWLLDGTKLGPAAALVPWDPTPGRHRLSLVDERERPLDTVAFEVRGAAGTRTDR